MINIKKSWKSSVVGLIILGYVIYRAFWLNLEIDFNSILALLVSIGFFFVKDADQTHSLPSVNSTVDPVREFPDTRG
tara:strand:- start:788 stop:1018 length:231 start_codon:yes stop_codon:yes gene_type:complete